MLRKKKLGIIGGMGSRAGAMFFNKVIDSSPALTDQDFIEVILHSNPAIPDRTRYIVHREESPVPELLRSIRFLNKSHVDYIVVACITAHYFYDILQANSHAEILHPIKITREHIQSLYPKIKRIGLLATTGTIQSGIFHRQFEQTGIELVTLTPEDNENIFMKSVYMQGGLKSSQVSQNAIDLLYETIPRLLDQGAELIIGGCTEIQIALQENGLSIPFVEPMSLTAQEAIRLCYRAGVQVEMA